MGKPVIIKTIQEMEKLFSEDPDLMFQIVAKAMSTAPGDPEKIRESHRAYQHRKKLKTLEVPPHKLTV